MLTDYLDNYSVLLHGEKNSKKFQIFKKMQMKLGATQTEPYLALCHNMFFLGVHRQAFWETSFQIGKR